MLFRLTGVVATIALALAFACTASAQTQHPGPDGIDLMDMGPGDTMLMDIRGFTLYVRDTDPIGKSTCTGACTKAWPPLLVSTRAHPRGNYTIIVRNDGKRQWAYKGKPLYLFKRDRVPMETRGNGVLGWHLAKP